MAIGIDASVGPLDRDCVDITAGTLRIRPHTDAYHTYSEIVLYERTGGVSHIISAAYRPDTASNAANATLTVNAAGDYPVTAAAASITGLTPGIVRKVTGTVAIRMAGGASTAAQWGMQITHSGGTSFSGVRSTDVPTAVQVNNFTWSGTYTVPANGTLTVTPCVRWGVGSVSVTWASATITVL